ncbi:MAG: hypothetical protein ACK5LX_04725 [Oscillospiraceae bacterium]
MNKKQIIILGSSILGIALLCTLVVVFFNFRNAPAIADGIPVAAEATSSEEVSAPEVEDVAIASDANEASVPEISSSAPDIIPDDSSSTADNLPSPGVTESSDGSGGVVQTPNWEDQKTLKPGTDLEDPEKEPEYVGTPSKPPVTTPPSTEGSSSQAPTGSGTTGSSSTPSTPSSSFPKPGDTKEIDGVLYGYVEGFGWVKYGGENEGTVVDAPTTGNIVGHKIALIIKKDTC